MSVTVTFTFDGSTPAAAAIPATTLDAEKVAGLTEARASEALKVVGVCPGGARLGGGLDGGVVVGGVVVGGVVVGGGLDGGGLDGLGPPSLERP